MHWRASFYFCWCSSKVNIKTKNGLNLSKKEQERYEIQKEILQALFDAPGRYDDVDAVICPLREVGKSMQVSHIVEKPLPETLERQILIRTPQSDAKSKQLLLLINCAGRIQKVFMVTFGFLLLRVLYVLFNCLFFYWFWTLVWQNFFFQLNLPLVSQKLECFVFFLFLS